MKIFKDLKVLDLSTVLAGPSVATFFAELGADVIKVENKKIPDVTRSWKLPTENPNLQISAYFSSINYLKSYVSLDFKNESDYNELLSLVKSVDVLISNFKFGDEEKLKITDEILRAENPNLIIGKINGFGEDSDRVAYDLILQAETGFMSMNGTPESGPVKMPVALIDVLAAHQLKEALLLSIIRFNQDKIPSTVSVSLYEAAVSSLVNQASNFLMNNHIPQRIGSLHPNIAPYGEIFQTNDDQLITFAIGSDVHFQKLCAFLELSDLYKDERFSNNQSRVINRKALQDLLQEKIIDCDSDIIVDTLVKQHVPVGKIKNIQEVFNNQKAKDLIKEEIQDEVLTRRISSIAFKWK